MTWYFDTSVIVAAAVGEHPHNARALAVLENLLGSRRRGSISAHGLTEIYSVLTRTPFKPPLRPADVWRIIDDMVLPHMDLIALTAREHRELVQQCATAGWSGGRIHDAVHLRCAVKARAERVYTFNVKDFRAMAPDELRDKIAAP